MVIKQQLNPILAEAYFEGALKEINMPLLTTILEEVRSVIFKESDPFKILKLLDIKIGSTQDKFIVKELVKIKKKYSEQYIKNELEFLHRQFKKNRKNGFKIWYALYIKSILSWRSYFAEKLAEESFPFPLSEMPLVKKIQKYTRYIRLERWIDCYPLFEALRNYKNNSKRSTSRILVILAEIEMYLNYNMARAKKYLDAAKQLSPDDSWIDLGFGIYALQNNEIETAKKLIAKFAKNDPMNEEGYYLQGDCYARLEKYDIAEQWYFQGINQTGDNYNKYLQLFKVPDFFQKNQDKFIKVVEAALVSTDDDYLYSIRLAIGSVFVANKQYIKGINWYRKAISLDPARIDGYIFLSDTYLNLDLNQFLKARRCCRKVIKMEPRNFDGYWALASTYEVQEKWKEAILWYKKSLLYRKTGKSVILCQIADVYKKAGEYAMAEKELLEALHVDPEESRVINSINNLAYVLYTEHNEIEIAVALYEKVVKKQGKSHQAETYNQIGNAWFFHRQFKKAQNAYQKACEINDREAVYFANLGGALREQNKNDEAIVNYTKASVLSPENDDYYNQIGRLLYSKNEIEKSLEWYRKAINIRPGLAVYHSNLGLALSDLKKWEEAEDALFTTVKLEPDNDIYWNNLGLIFYNQGKDEIAISYYRKAAEIKPDIAVYHANMGLSLGFLNKWADTVEAYQSAVRLDTTNVSYLERLGIAARRTGNWEVAESSYRRALELDPRNDTYLNALGLIFHDQNNENEAIKYYQMAIEINYQSAIYHANCGLSFELLNQWEEAVKSYQVATELDKNTAGYWEGLGISAGKNNEPERAINAYRKALELEPENDVFWNNLGLIYHDQHREEEAITNYQKAIEINPDNYIYHANIGLSMALLFRWEDAFNSYQSAIQKEAGDPNLWNAFGLLYYNQNIHEKAIPNFQKAIEIDPETAVYWANLGLSLGYLGHWDDAVKASQKAYELDNGNQVYHEILEFANQKKTWSAGIVK